MKTPKRDPRTGRFVKTKTSSRSASRGASPWSYRANPKKTSRKPKGRATKKTSRKPKGRKSSFWGF